MFLNIHHRTKPIRGAIHLPGDKSIAQRAIILAAIADSKSTLRNIPLSDDCLSVIRCIRQLGVKVKLSGTTVIIDGRGLHGLKKPSTPPHQRNWCGGKPLNVGESGTAARLLTGLLAGQSFPSIITGKKTVLARPMKRVIEPLCLMGAEIKSKNGRLPIHIYPNPPQPPFVKGGNKRGDLTKGETGEFHGRLKGISYTMPIASAQVKSAILLAGLYADGVTVVREKIPTRDHTERLLRLMGASVGRIANGELRIANCKKSSLTCLNIEIPGDFSSAAYFIAAGLLIPGSNITIKDVGLNPYRTGLLTILKRMKALVRINSQFAIRNSQLYAEPVGDILVKYSQLKGINVPKEIIPSLIDEIPILSLIATQAKGTTIIKGAGELRVKETDRIKAIVTELAKLGANISETADGMIIKGQTKLYGAKCLAHNDHRIAMTLAIAGLIAQGRTKISGFEVVNKSFPSFLSMIENGQGRINIL